MDPDSRGSSEFPFPRWCACSRSEETVFQCLRARAGLPYVRCRPVLVGVVAGSSTRVVSSGVCGGSSGGSRVLPCVSNTVPVSEWQENSPLVKTRQTTVRARWNAWNSIRFCQREEGACVLQAGLTKWGGRGDNSVRCAGHRLERHEPDGKPYRSLRRGYTGYRIRTILERALLGMYRGLCDPCTDGA